jgi:hypothetical protein
MRVYSDDGWKDDPKIAPNAELAKATTELARVMNAYGSAPVGSLAAAEWWQRAERALAA